MNSAAEICPKCGGPRDTSGRCDVCSARRSDRKTVMVPVQRGRAELGAADPASDDLGKVALPAGWEVHLDVVEGAAPRTHRITRTRVIIGRGAVDVALEDPRVSRRHASLEIYGAACVLLKDLGSTNGTYVNGRRVTACELADGDEISAGDTKFVITIGAPPK